MLGKVEVASWRLWHGKDTLARRFMTLHGAQNCSTGMLGKAWLVIFCHVACWRGTLPAGAARKESIYGAAPRWHGTARHGTAKHSTASILRARFQGCSLFLPSTFKFWTMPSLPRTRQF